MELKAYRNLYNEAVEKCLLSALLVDLKRNEFIFGEITPEDFINTENGRIYQAIQELWISGRTPDVVSLSSVTSFKYQTLVDLLEFYNPTIDLKGAVLELKNRARLKKILNAMDIVTNKIAVAENLEETYLESIEILGESFSEISSKDIVTISEVLEEYQSLAEERKLRRYTTGYRGLDELTGGFKEGQLILIASRPSVGKTAMCINLIDRLIKRHNFKVLFFSIEMDKFSILERFLAIAEGLPITDIQDAAQDDPLYLKAIGEKINSRYGDRLLLCLDTALNPVKIKAKMKRLRLAGGIDAVFLDYVQLLSGSNKSRGRVEEMSEIIRELKLISREFEIPMFVVSQLSRAPEVRADKRPFLSDLRESGALEQEADIVFLLYRQDYYKKELANRPIVDLEVLVAKNRNGPTGVTILKFDKKNNIISGGDEFKTDIDLGGEEEDEDNSK